MNRFFHSTSSLFLSRPSKNSTTGLANSLLESTRLFSTEKPVEFRVPKTGGFEEAKIVRAKAEKKPIYLDLQATTPMDPRVLDKMMPFLTFQYGNPHSRTHQFGWDSERAVEDARAQVAALIGADGKEIVFTSGATEANNLCIKGIAHFYGSSRDSQGRLRKHVITTQTEHKCVLDSCRQLESEGYEVTFLPVEHRTGLLRIEDLKAAMREDTLLVSVMAVNNEIGVIQPIHDIGRICRDRGVFFHTDAAQAVGKIPLDVNEMNIDCMSISGHKVYGPKGVGALYVRRRPRVRLYPLFSGGGQERGIRSGTVPTPLVVGLGEACALAQQEMASDTKHIKMLSDRLLNGLRSKIPHLVRNGDENQSYPGCINLSFAYVEGESLLMALKKIALSSGSACTSASLEPSYVLRALGAQEDMAHSSIRFGIGRFTTIQEIDFCIEETVKHVTKLRELSPLWEMVQEGIDINSIQWSQH
jgi:cysteine desulfurase